MLAGWTGYIAGSQQFERESNIVRRVDYHGGTLEWANKYALLVTGIIETFGTSYYLSSMLSTTVLKWNGEQRQLEDSING